MKTKHNIHRKEHPAVSWLRGRLRRYRRLLDDDDADVDVLRRMACRDVEVAKLKWERSRHCSGCGAVVLCENRSVQSIYFFKGENHEHMAE